MRIIVTGSRHWKDEVHRRLMAVKLYELAAEVDVTLVHGDARGADRMAAAMARELGWQVEAWPVSAAQWDASRRAGFDRNERMLDSGADLVLAFRASGYSGGTDHAVAYARDKGMRVEITREKS